VSRFFFFIGLALTVFSSLRAMELNPLLGRVDPDIQRLGDHTSLFGSVSVVRIGSDPGCPGDHTTQALVLLAEPGFFPGETPMGALPPGKLSEIAASVSARGLLPEQFTKQRLNFAIPLYVSLLKSVGLDLPYVLHISDSSTSRSHEHDLPGVLYTPLDIRDPESLSFIPDKSLQIVITDIATTRFVFMSAITPSEFQLEDVYGLQLTFESSGKWRVSSLPSSFPVGQKFVPPLHIVRKLTLGGVLVLTFSDEALLSSPELAAFAATGAPIELLSQDQVTWKSLSSFVQEAQPVTVVPDVGTFCANYYKDFGTWCSSADPPTPQTCTIFQLGHMYTPYRSDQGDRVGVSNGQGIVVIKKIE
jgi:hypothetical protein